MLKSLRHVSFTILCLSAFFASAQDISNKGKEFWLGYGYCWTFDAESPVNTQELVLYLSAEQPANVTVSVSGTTWSQSVSIPANTVNAAIKIPKSGVDDARIFNEGVFDRAVHIVSDTPIVVYAHEFNPMVSGATMLMPVESFGYEYYSLNYSQSQSGSSPPNPPATTTQNGPAWYSWFYVVATEDNTRIEITPSDTTRNGWLPGQTYTVNLNKGQLYNVMGKLGAGNSITAASKDMTGSKVLSVPGADASCHPVALFSGSSGIRICKNDGGEYMQQQVFPLRAWGTRYLTYHMLNNTTTNINDPFKNFYRVAVTDPTTVVKRNGVVMTGLINNFYYEWLDSTGGDYIESDKPILLAQYTPGGNRCYLSSQTAYGDPEMFYLSPLEQGRKDVLFYATRNSFIDYNYLNVIVSTAGISSLRLDANAFNPANIIPHPNLAGYSVAVARITGAAAQHRLTCDSNFTGTLYGLGLFESYGYNVGTFINNLNHYSEIRNVFNTSNTIDTFTCPKSPVRLYVKIGFPASSIHWKLSQVPGMSPNSDSIINNPIPVGTEQINARTYYIYSLQQDFVFSTTGNYSIPVTYTTAVSASCNQTETVFVNVVVKPGPIADFSISSPTCLSDSIQFTGGGNSNGFTISSYLWGFDDMTTQTTQNAVKKFNTAGNQNVSYSIIASNGCLGDTTKSVLIFDSPVAKFGVTTNICSNDSVRITDSSTISSGVINSWKWDMGDGNIFTNSNNNLFHHHYTNPGTYIVSLIVTSDDGCKSDTAFLPVTILTRPTANFVYDHNICVGDSIFITDNSTFNSGTITNWYWSLGDGNSFNAANNTSFYHTYSVAGNYPVSLAVTGNNGCISDTFRLTVNVSSKPTASFIISGKPCIDSAYSFTSSVVPNASNPPTWFWDFGDAQTFNSATTNIASHPYNTALTNITVKHWVSYSAGCSSDTSVNTIPVINANPVALFTVTGAPFCEKSPVNIASTTTGVNKWEWSLGNTNSNTVPPFSYTFNNTGNINVSLIVRTVEGCGSATLSQMITINPLPLIDAGTDKYISLGSGATIDATITNPANYDFIWTPSVFLNDPTILNPVSVPAIPTSYTIRATDKQTGCYAEDVVTISPVSDIYIPTAFTPNNDGKNDRWEIPGLALYPEAQVSIFSRWGQKLFETKNYIDNPWNGFFKSVLQPQGVYVYILQLNDDKKQFFKGTVTLVR